jgi:hypothetical protein
MKILRKCRVVFFALLAIFTDLSLVCAVEPPSQPNSEIHQQPVVKPVDDPGLTPAQLKDREQIKTRTLEKKMQETAKKSRLILAPPAAAAGSWVKAHPSEAAQAEEHQRFLENQERNRSFRPDAQSGAEYNAQGRDRAQAQAMARSRATKKEKAKADAQAQVQQQEAEKAARDAARKVFEQEAQKTVGGSAGKAIGKKLFR